VTDELTEQVAQAIEDMLEADDGWCVGTPALHGMFVDFATAAIAAARPALLEEGARLGAKAAAALFMDQDNLAPEYDFSRLNYAEIVKGASA